MSIKRIWAMIKETFSEWSDDRVPRKSAALAYYTVFSIAPILVIAIAIAGFVFGQEAAQGKINEQINGLVGESGAKIIQEMIAASRNQEAGFVATAIGIAVLLFGATGLFAELHSSLNSIWEVKPKAGSGLLQTLRERFLSFTMVLGIGFLLLVSLVLSAALTALGTYMSGLLPGMTTIVHVLNFVISFAVVALLFAMMFKILPDAEIAWRDVWIGAAVTALLFVIGKYAIALYLGAGAVSSSFGAAGALVIILVWVYYAAQILFLGAEFTQVYARHYGSRIVPSENAVPEESQAPAEMPASQLVTRQEKQSRQGNVEPAPWQPRGERSLGSIGSLAIGIVLGVYYALRGKKRFRT